MKKQDLKQIIREEIRKVLKEHTVMSFSYAKPFKGSQSELTKIKSEIKAFIEDLQSKNYSARPGENALYFPKFRDRGPTIAVMVGSDMMFLRQIGSKNIIKISEHWIAQDFVIGHVDGYLIPGEN